MTRPISETELQLNLARALYAARPELVWQNGEARALPFDLSREGARLSIDQARAVIRLLKDNWEAIMAGGMLGVEAMEKAGVALSGVRITEAHLDAFESVTKLPGDDPGGYESRYQSSGADLPGFALQDARPVSITRHATLTPDGYFAAGRKLEPRPIENLTGDVANLNAAPPPEKDKPS